MYVLGDACENHERVATVSPSEEPLFHSAGCFSGLPLNPFLVLDLGLQILDRVGRLDVEGDGLPSESLDEDLHLIHSATIL